MISGFFFYWLKSFLLQNFWSLYTFLSENMRNEHLATFTKNLKVIETPVVFFSPIYFVGAPVFLPQQWKLLGPERLMPLKLLGMNRVKYNTVMLECKHNMVILNTALILFLGVKQFAGGLKRWLCTKGLPLKKKKKNFKDRPEDPRIYCLRKRGLFRYLHNTQATCQHISEKDLTASVSQGWTLPKHLLPHWDRSYKSNLLSHLLTQSQYSKLHIGHTEQCPCGTDSPATEHLLQSCPLYERLRKGIWPDYTPIACKLFSSLGEPMMYCHLHRGDWSFHLMNEKKTNLLTVHWQQASQCQRCPDNTRHLAG